jgi:hypothetical protein
MLINKVRVEIESEKEQREQMKKQLLRRAERKAVEIEAINS